MDEVTEVGNETAVVPRPLQHRVRFYDRDDELVAELAGIAVEALTRGEPLLCVATPEHRESLETVLAARGVDLVAARAAGGYHSYDAEEMLGLFLRDGRPDASLFQSTVGALVDDLAAGGKPPQVYGEMVALLWERGEVVAAIELERLWNDLATTRDFSLLCGYPSTSLEVAGLDDASDVCALHSEVLAPESYRSSTPSSLLAESMVMVPVPEAVPAARRFVSALLPEDMDGDLASETQLVVSELATNAVIHARSAFRLSVRRVGDSVRITVQDSNSAAPRESAPAPEKFGGRGVSIVSKLAESWGYDVLADGKVVWAELSDPFGASRTST